MVDRLVQTNDIGQFHEFSVEFANYVNIVTPKMKMVIEDLRSHGIKSGVALFGETVFTLVPEHLEDKAVEILERYQDGIIIKSKIDDIGARLVS